MGLLSLLFSFNGRINRMQYWMGSLLTSLLGIAILVALIASAGMSFDGGKTNAAQALSALGGLVLIGIPVLILMCWIGLSLQVKRFHDRGRTGWIALLPIVVSMFIGSAVIGHIASATSPAEFIAAMQPYSLVMNLINLAFFIDLGCLGSVEGPNKYGDHPTNGGRPSSSPGPAPSKPNAPAGAEPAMSTLFGAQSAMERAIAAQGRVVQAQKPVRVAAATAPSAMDMKPAPGGFGRRPAR